jgi:hypothetical protein
MSWGETHREMIVKCKKKSAKEEMSVVVVVQDSQISAENASHSNMTYQ